MIKVEKEGGITRVILTADQFHIGNNPNWKLGEKTLKIKAKHDCIYGGYKSGDIFDVTWKNNEVYAFYDKDSCLRAEFFDKFDIVNEPKIAEDTLRLVAESKPTIEVGSEWVSSSGVDWKVVYSGKSIVVTHANCENTLRREKFLEKYKPKPKTVTMYFYKVGDIYVAYSYKSSLTEFTREIELP